MTIRVALRHKTSYSYDRRITLGPQVVRLRPAPHSRTEVVSYALHVSPQSHFLNWQQDPQGNFLARLVFQEPTDHFTLDVELLADLRTINPFDFFLEPHAETVPFKYDEASLTELGPYLALGEGGPLLDALVAGIRLHGQRTVDFLVALNQSLHARTKYVIRMEPGVQTPEQTLELASGSCRDSAWLLVQTLRRLGYAARFASGYLIQLKADQKPLEGPAGPEADFTDLHAWAEVYLPGAGWVGLDVTSGLFTGEGHIPLACTPDPSSASPISGSLDECEVTFHHEMSVERVRETPRVTAPYTDAVWQRIEALGHAIDGDLDALDVRLTMGGEPTFVSVDDPDGLEWNFTALGANKRRLAGQLFRRLAHRFAKDPLLHYGQGKWYPGEPLPRWALGCFFRKDGDSIWRREELFANDDVNYGASEQTASRFIERLAARLEVDASHAMAAYEDPFHYMLTERRLPSNVTPLDNRLDNPLERERVARLFERGLGRVVGYALPIRPVGAGAWQSGSWFLRRELLYLTPGDSPMGYRLPIDSLPWVAEADYPYVNERDPFAERKPLAPYDSHVEIRRQQPGPTREGDESVRRAKPSESAHWIVRTALCVEPRDGTLHVFLPPAEELEDYLDLVRRIESVAAELDQPVRIEGYAPPQDPRLQKFTVTPDPGVIEVNIHPTASWDGLVKNTTALYEEARECRLGTEKFMLDGRHSGTGGGNHVTLGGSTPSDSPLLRRPDLLASLVGYWHDHPALSYLFSGLFIGPTSQAPRVDEARHEATYELETALSEARRVQSHGGRVAPWLVDRIFRNLLCDVTGNTHRTEFCIDKLYSPDSATGRLGLLEMRAFEMPPHARMSLAQTLLVRGLVSRFWKRPYESKASRWGTSLHDRFMLPHFVWQDFRDVVRELGEAGYPFEDNWFHPHFEFRFPAIGSVSYDSAQVELRRALEPWHVLAEESSSAGTARSVDSSLERIQVLLRGGVPGRHQLICNGARVPLHPTGTRGEAVAGVRFRAWQIPSQLHPTQGVHAPLELSLIDTWSERALGGCRLYVSHPGGRSYDRFPVNALEAESRRATLFVAHGHNAGRFDASRVVDARSPDYPLTLDLRRLAVPPPGAGQMW
ncbi:MAG TPA: transglutaminase family protein [Polyangiaceae bacterium]|nr:transglutaminase family protein [Polyangiaceae bacterium]